MKLYLRLFLVSLFWGSNIIVMKIILNDISFLMLALLRVLLSLLCLSIYMLYKRITLHYPYHKQALIIGLLGIYLNFVFTFMGMQEVSGQGNAFMNALAPIVTFVFSMIFLKQKAYKHDYIALILALLAFLISIHFDMTKINLGIIYLFIGMMLYMLSNVLIQKFQLQQSLTLIFYELLYGFMALCIHTFIIRAIDISSLTHLSLLDWLLLIMISGIGFAFIQTTYLISIDTIGAYKTSFYLSINPIITYIESLQCH
ncbi:MAG: DMT family transporter [Erysipelotrichaceae bacterium]|nr:DMT family transporter [Erysipelotrichaceae bacterium]